MKRTVRSLLGATLALAAVGGWEWAAGPAVYELPGADPGGFVYAEVAPTARWLVVTQSEGGRFWLLDHHAGRLTGPRAMPADHSAAVDAAGRVHFLPVEGRGPAGRFAVFRHDPATDTYPEAWGRAAVIGWQRLDAATGGPAVAVATGGPGRPLRVEVVDLFTGAVRAALDFPDRTGNIARDVRADAAACGWRVSDDGTRLVLGERLRGGRPAGPPGLELWDLLAGKLVRTLDTGDRWAINPVFTDDGRAVWSQLHPRTGLEPYTVVAPRWYWDWDTGRRLDGPPDPPTPAGAEYWANQSDGLTLWTGYTPEDSVRLTVTADDGRPTAGWVTVPQAWAGDSVEPVDARFAPGTTGILLCGDDAHARPGWGWWLLRKLGFSDPAHVTTVAWYDWQAGTVRRLRAYPFDNGSASARVQPGRLTVVVNDSGAGRPRLEVWPTPPPTSPPVWLWPVTLVAGGLVGRCGNRGKP